MEYLQWNCLLVSYIVLVFVIKIMNFLWWRPRNIMKHFKKQGIKGPTYHFLRGNNKDVTKLILNANSSAQPISHDIGPRVLPFYYHYKQIHGAPFLLWFGTTARLTISDPNLLREIFVSKSEFFEKYEPNPVVRNLEGGSLVNLKGEKWVLHRKIITPTFNMDNLKLMIPMIGRKVAGMLEKWAKMSDSGEVEIDVSKWFQSSTEEIIMGTLFGCPIEYGKSIFEVQAEQMVSAIKSFQEVFIPGFRHVPTKKNRNSWTLDKKIRVSLSKLIQRHQVEKKLCNTTSTSNFKDLLDVLISSSDRKSTIELQLNSNHSLSVTQNDIIEECKGFSFAGKYTTTNLMTWTMILLAMHPTWQQLAREEVLSTCGSRDMPNKDDVAKLKMMHMILYESLRLYPPVVATIRKAKSDVDLGGIKIPKGVEILIPVIAIHHDENLWGGDANDFNPRRFSQGVGHAAKHPMAFIPFALGARRCIGQNLAILQAKLTIAMILQRFSFELAPNYKHAPTVLMILYPRHGAPLIFRDISSSSSI